MNTVQSKDGTTIAFDRSGEGPVIILVGGATQDRSDSASLAALLAPRFTVINYDRRGRGDSGDTAPYAVEREVQGPRVEINVSAPTMGCQISWASTRQVATYTALGGSVQRTALASFAVKVYRIAALLVVMSSGSLDSCFIFQPRSAASICSSFSVLRQSL